jgi:aerobic carbon-monoxide dehydrogenase large subunit
MGSYDVPNYHSEMKVVFTNRTIVTPVRGAGRPQGIFLAERLLDLAARELGIDRWRSGAATSSRPTPFPYDTRSSTRPSRS